MRELALIFDHARFLAYLNRATSSPRTTFSDAYTRANKGSCLPLKIKVIPETIRLLTNNVFEARLAYKKDLNDTAFASCGIGQKKQPGGEFFLWNMNGKVMQKLVFFRKGAIILQNSSNVYIYKKSSKTRTLQFRVATIAQCANISQVEVTRRKPHEL